MFHKIFRASKVPTQSNPFLGLLKTGNESKTGVSVDEEEALSSSAVWSAVTQLSQTIGSLPLHYYVKQKDGGKKKYSESPLYNLMHLKPNSEMTAMVFREAQMAQVLLMGTSFAEVERDKLGRITGLWPLLTARMQVLRDRESTELYYKYQLHDGTYHIFHPVQILRVTGFSHSGILGYRPIDKNVETVGLNLALQEYFARFFGDGATPPAVLEHPEQMSEEAQQRLRKQWFKNYGGLSNKHRMAILEEGMKLHVFGVTPEQAQAIEARQFQIQEVCRLFNMPPHLLKELSRATYSNIYEQSLEFVIYTLRPWLVRLEQAYNVQLIESKFQKKYFFEHSVEGLLRGDIEKRYNAYQVAIQNGWMNADEVRTLENMNPQPNGLGKKYYIPLNWSEKSKADELLMQSQQKAEQEPEPDEEETKTYWRSKIHEIRSVVERDRITKQYYPLFREAAQVVVTKEALAVKKQVKSENRAKSDIEKWLDEFYGKHREFIKTKLGPVFRSFAEAIQAASAKEIGVDVGIDADLEVFISDFIDRYADRHIDSSTGQLISLLEGELEELQIRADEWTEKRPDKIATNETVRLDGAVYSFMAFGAGLGVYWRIRGTKTCPYCQELNGKRVVSGQSFVNDGDAVKPKGQEPMRINGTKAHPPLHRGCDCYISAI